MSERQAKIKRKNEIEENKNIHKKTKKSDVLFNVILVVVTVAILGLGAWAVASKYTTNGTSDTTTEQSVDDSASQETPTVEEYAESLGQTAEEFMTEYGLDQNSEVTKDMQMTLATEYMTLANYAKLSGTDTQTMKDSMGLSEDETITDDTVMSDIYDKMMSSADNGEAESDTESENQ